MLNLFSTEGFIYPIVVVKKRYTAMLWEFNYFIEGRLLYKTISHLDNPHVCFQIEINRSFDSQISRYKVIEC